MIQNLDKLLHRVQKPARYTGNEWNTITKDWNTTPVKTVLIFPDSYEIGMSNMAIQILYDLLNRREDTLAERAFSPWPDMEDLMRQEKVPLFSLESRMPVSDFDIIGFSMGYELCYTNVLNALDLVGIPVLAEERGDSFPLVIAGGGSTVNPEPMARFIDLFVIGEGEEVLSELIDCFVSLKKPGKRIEKKGFLRKAASIPGVYVPSFYSVSYDSAGHVTAVTPDIPEAPPVIQRRIVDTLPPPVTSPIVPFIEVVHDRGAIEIQRGCSHGCRFCQAGIIYRPVRERPLEEVMNAADEIIANCGYNELSLVSLSTSDYAGIEKLAAGLVKTHKHLSISLPSLFIDSFSVNLLDSISSQKKTGLTFAPEAGSERMRKIINKNITEEQLLATAADAFSRGWNGLKLYFMIGLPGETPEDIEAICRLAENVYATARKTGGRPPQIRLTISTFIPKPHTPFQWAAQDSEESIRSKQEIVRNGLRRKAFKLSWSDTESSLLEAVFSRGDRRIGEVIYRAWKLGCRFDAWNEHFKYETWLRAFNEAGLDPDFYARRERPLDEMLPWSHIQTGVSTDFLKRELRKSQEAMITADCRTGNCNGCGLEKAAPGCITKINSTS